jgi:hypothetical protein
MTCHAVRVLLCVLALGASRVEAGHLTLFQDQLLGLNPGSLDPAGAISMPLGTMALPGDGVAYMGVLGSGMPPTGSPVSLSYGASAADLFGGSDLSHLGADYYGLRLHNLDDDRWTVNVYIETAANGKVTSDSYLLGANESQSIAIDLGGLDLSNVLSLGFTIRADQWYNSPIGGGSANPMDPSDPDIYKIAAAPVPEPATLTLMGAAAGAFALRAARRRQKRAI